MKVGIIGYGLMGKRRHKALPAEDDVVVFDTAQPGLDDVLGYTQACNADATIISVPTPLLARVCIEAMQAGARRILLEKPCATTSEDARAVLSSAEMLGAIVVPAYTLRHYPGVRAARYDNRYGSLLWGSIGYGHGGGAGAGWRASSGELLDQGSHVIDLAEWFVPGQRMACAKLDELVADVEDHVNIQLSRFSLTASWVLWLPTFVLRLTYERGVCEVSGLGGPYGDHTVMWRAKHGHIDEARTYGDARELALLNEWHELVDTTSNDRLRDAIRVLELIEEARRCAS